MKSRQKDDDQDQFQRGQELGAVMARLQGHDKEIMTLRTGQTQISSDLVALKLSTQELAGAALSAAKTVEQTAKAATDARLATAAALKEAKDRDAETLRVAAITSKATWSPFQKMLLVLTTLTGLGILFLTWLHG